METGFWEGIGYLLLFPVMLVVMLFAVDFLTPGPWRIYALRDRWGPKSRLIFILIVIVATAIWWGVFLEPNGF